jgi:hypothetical protein
VIISLDAPKSILETEKKNPKNSLFWTNIFLKTQKTPKKNPKTHPLG